MRSYPDRPIVGVGAVVLDGRRVVLVKRANEPLKGEWSLPGGAVDVGETLEEAIRREVREETGLDVEVGPIVDVLDRIRSDPDGRVKFHYVLIDFLCRPAGGELRCASDAEEAAWADGSDLKRYHVADATISVIDKGIARAATGWMSTGSKLNDVVSGLSRDDAWRLLNEYTKGESLLKHALAVEAAVRGYARRFGEDEVEWGIVGLLHDFDYERWPTAADHPFRGCEILEARGYPEWMRRAILSHADYSGVPRESLLEKTLFACDEMAGFVTAASLVRPSRSVLDLEASSVVKRMKDKAFARGVKRDDLRAGADVLGLPLDEHIANVIASLRDQADALGLRGTL